MPQKREHAILSASSAARWLHCTRSPRLEETLPDTESPYAAEGTLAHAVGELKLRKKFTPMKLSEYTRKMKKLKADPLFTAEMDRATDDYLELVTGFALAYPVEPFVAIETRLDFSQIVPEGFGTGDCVLLGGDTLHIIDLKYGKGVAVEAEGNPQLRLYALGAVLGYGMLYDIQRVRMTIFQPRLNSTSTAEMTRDQLLDWASFEVKPKAALAYAGEGEFIPGGWCRFCRAKALCRVRADIHTALEDFKDCVPLGDCPGELKGPAAGVGEGTLLTDTQVGELLVRGKGLVQWYKDLEGYALDALLSGKEIPGWKAVEGRSIRRWVDMEAAFHKLLELGWAEPLLYHREPITLADVEKLLGKTQFAELCGEYVERPTGRPVLVPTEDKRPPYSTAAADFAEVSEGRWMDKNQSDISGGTTNV